MPKQRTIPLYPAALQRLADVSAPAPAAGDALQFDGPSQRWTPQAPSTDAATLEGHAAADFVLALNHALHHLLDVDVTGAVDGDGLVFDEASGLWVPAAIVASDADTVDGKHAADFLLAGATAVDSDKVDGKHASDFVLGSQFSAGNVAYDAANFSTSTGGVTWDVEAGDLQTYRYVYLDLVVAKLMFLVFSAWATTSVTGGTAGQLKLKIPLGKLGASAGVFPIFTYQPADGQMFGYGGTAAGSGWLGLIRDQAASKNWPANVNQTGVSFSALFEVQ